MLLLGKARPHIRLAEVPFLRFATERWSDKRGLVFATEKCDETVLGTSSQFLGEAITNPEVGRMVSSRRVGWSLRFVTTPHSLSLGRAGVGRQAAVPVPTLTDRNRTGSEVTLSPWARRGERVHV